MKDEYKERYPPYLPFYYKVYFVLRKLYGQSMTRYHEKKARKNGPVGLFPDGVAFWMKESAPNPVKDINKAAFWIDEDMQIPGVREVAESINKLKVVLDNKNLKYTTTAGTFITRMFYDRTEKTKLWENSWSIYHSQVKSGERVLDIGGASTIFSFYLGYIGCSVDVIDNDWSNCGMNYNANYVAKKMGWDLKAIDHDVAKPLPYPDNYFDHVFSICVIEHLTSRVRRFMMKELARVTKPEGRVSLTTDYDHGRKELLTDKGLRFGFREKIIKDIVDPSGLQLRGNVKFVDIHPDKNFLGALFLEKQK